MSKAARSLWVFGIYLAVMGGAIVVQPNRFLALFGFPPTPEAWFRILGVVLVYVGTYYIQSARHELVPIFRASIPVRLSLVAFLSAFVLLGYVKTNVILFGVADAAGALWTLTALRATNR